MLLLYGFFGQTGSSYTFVALCIVLYREHFARNLWLNLLYSYFMLREYFVTMIINVAYYLKSVSSNALCDKNKIVHL